MKLLVRMRDGDVDQVIAELKAMTAGSDSTYTRGWRIMLAVLQNDRTTFETTFAAEVGAARDPEGMYYWALVAAVARDETRTLDLLGRAVERGWMCTQALASPWLDLVHGEPRFVEILRSTETRQRAAAAKFLQAGGDKILGVRGLS